MHSWLRRRGARFVLYVWLAVTVVAVVGMYHLWWTRERVLYAGKDVHEQRAEVFRRAGIASSLLNDTEKILRGWPAQIRYAASGNHNQLSYVLYLLIPRIPDGGPFALREQEGRLFADPELPPALQPPAAGPAPRGLILSLLSIVGIASLLGRIPVGASLSAPERFGAAVFLLALLAVLSRGILQDAAAGFWIAAAAGTAGWLLFFLHRSGGRSAIRNGVRFIGEGLQELKRSQLPAVYVVVAGIMLAVVLWSLLMSVVVVPDDWDAWAIWGSKAKILALGTGPLRDVTLFPHADYPLLWPAVWAFSGWCAGGWEEHWSRAWGPIFMILSAWQIGVVIRRLTGQSSLGWIGAVFFLSMPMVPLLASWSYAEAPLWLLVTCAFGRLLLWRKEKENHHLLIAALFSVAAAYTKNEGLFFSAVCFVWLIVTVPKSLWACIRWYALPIVLLYLPWFLWVRGALQLGARAYDGFKGGPAAVMRALERLPEALRSIGVMWLDVRQWNLVVWIVLAFSVWHLLRGNGRRMDLFVPLIMLLAFFTINVFHAEDIGLIMTSWNRLTVQTLPLFIIILCVNYLPATLEGNHS
jgi:hypothetical protein